MAVEKKQNISNTFGFQPCQTHTYQAPFERRRRAKRAPRVFQRTHTKAPFERRQRAKGAPRVFQHTHTDHPSSAGGRAKRAPRLAQRTHTKHPSLCQSASTAMQSLHISWKNPSWLIQQNWRSFRSSSSKSCTLGGLKQFPFMYACYFSGKPYLECSIWSCPFELKAEL